MDKANAVLTRDIISVTGVKVSAGERVSVSLNTHWQENGITKFYAVDLSSGRWWAVSRKDFKFDNEWKEVTTNRVKRFIEWLHKF